MTQGHFLRKSKQVWIQSFPSTQTIAEPQLKNPVYSTNSWWVKAVCIYPIFLPQAVCGKRSIFKQSMTTLNSKFSFSLTGCNTKVKEPSIPYYLLIAGERIVRFILFPRLFAQCEMQTASFRIWTQVAESIIHDNNCYSTKTFKQGLHKACSKSIKTEAVFTKTEINNEWSIYFFTI